MHQPRDHPKIAKLNTNIPSYELVALLCWREPALRADTDPKAAACQIDEKVTFVLEQRRERTVPVLLLVFCLTRGL